MEISINPQDINEYVKKVLIECSLGVEIKKAIDEALKEVLSHYDSPIKKLMKQHISDIVKEYIGSEQNKPLIYEAIAKIISPNVIENIISTGVYQLKKNLEDY